MMAKPAVEPSARCALMIPDAMPARSGGIEDMATFVVGATARPPAAPTSARPKQDDERRPADAGADDDEPDDEQRDSRASVGPAAADARGEAAGDRGDRMIVGIVKREHQHAGPLGAVVAGCSGSTA